MWSLPQAGNPAHQLGANRDQIDETESPWRPRVQDRQPTHLCIEGDSAGEGAGLVGSSRPRRTTRDQPFSESPTIHPVPTVNGGFRGRDILDPVRLTITFAFLVGAALALAQPPSKDPGSLKFEVASIKPSAPGGRGGGARPDPGGKRYRGTNVPLRLYMVACYRLRADQILNAPAWADSEPFDILAEAPKQSSVEEMYLMMRNLLIERCHLKFHLENRETNIYALTVDAAGAKLQRHDAANGGEPWIEQATVAPFHSKWTATAANMDIFTGRLSRMMDRPVIDMTGLAGDYDFTLSRACRLARLSFCDIVCTLSPATSRQGRSISALGLSGVSRTKLPIAAS